VCCCVLQCVAVWCSVLQCVAVCCGVLWCVALCCSVCCSVLQCVAVCCSALQRVAVCCSALQCVAVQSSGSVVGCCSMLHFFYIFLAMGWLRWVGSLKLKVPFAKEPYKRDDILQKRPIILRSLLIVATPYYYKKRQALVRCSVLQYVVVCCSRCWHHFEF